MIKWLAAAAGGLLLVTQASAARATSPMLFGYGPESTSVAQSDIAAASPSAAAVTNPSAAAEPGTRAYLGYAHAWTHLTLDGEPAPTDDIAGTDLAFQLGRRLGEAWSLGAGVAAHLPDRSLARVSFRPGADPLFVRFDPAPQRATADLALALRYRALSVGLGASVLVDARGEVRFLLGQDGNGPYAEGQTDVTLPYRVAPAVGASWQTGSVAIGARYRGALAVGLDLATQAEVRVSGNPLNGTTTVGVAGQSGYVPATWDIGARWDAARGVRLLGALQLARWSEAPAAAADLSLSVRLGLSPGQLMARFVRPALRDTLSPRAGLEVAPTACGGRLKLRAGYAYSPSPVPEQVGLATWADAPAHIASAGIGLDWGSAWGVSMRSSLAAQAWFMKQRVFDKPSEVLPFAHYRAGGSIFDLSASVEATWL